MKSICFLRKWHYICANQLRHYQRYGGAAFRGVSWTPEIFILLYFGPLFWPLGFHQAKLLIDNFQRQLEHFWRRQKFLKTPFFTTNGSNNRFLGQIWPKSRFWGQNPCCFKFQRLYRRNGGFSDTFGEVWSLHPHLFKGNPPHSSVHYAAYKKIWHCRRGGFHGDKRTCLQCYLKPGFWPLNNLGKVLGAKRSKKIAKGAM